MQQIFTMSLPLDLWRLARFFKTIWTTWESAGIHMSIHGLIHLPFQVHLTSHHSNLRDLYPPYSFLPTFKLSAYAPKGLSPPNSSVYPSLARSKAISDNFHPTWSDSKVEVMTEFQEETMIIIIITAWFSWPECQALYKLSRIYCSTNPFIHV